MAGVGGFGDVFSVGSGVQHRVVAKGASSGRHLSVGPSGGFLDRQEVPGIRR